MANCNKCGAQIDDNAAVCPSCGAQQNTAADTINAAFSAVNSMGEDFTSQFDRNDIEQNKIIAILSYIFILFLVPLLAAPTSRFARFHANQGLVLFICELVIGFVATIAMIILAFVPIVGGIINWCISGVLMIVFLIFMVLGIINAANGTAKELPVIGKIKILK